MTGHEVRWNDVRAELFAAVSAPLTPEVERLLLEILRFEGQLQLDELSEMPHRMSPEDMLKSLAVQSLGRWTGVTFLPTMRRLQATSEPALSCVIRAVIQKVSAENGRPHRPEAIEDFRIQASAREVEFGARNVADLPVERELGGRILHRALPVCEFYGMTFIPDDSPRSKVQPSEHALISL
jgi:hypothetical protein